MLPGYLATLNGFSGRQLVYHFGGNKCYLAYDDDNEWPPSSLNDSLILTCQPRAWVLA